VLIRVIRGKGVVLIWISGLPDDILQQQNRLKKRAKD
jgi:hypothetical protein